MNTFDCFRARRELTDDVEKEIGEHVSVNVAHVALVDGRVEFGEILDHHSIFSDATTWNSPSARILQGNAVDKPLNARRCRSRLRVTVEIDRFALADVNILGLLYPIGFSFDLHVDTERIVSQF